MLKVPAWRYFSDLRVTAYQDDAMFWRYYLIPDYISIRRDVKGDPVFLLIKYAFDDQDRQENKNLPRGGGYMAFDVEMAVAEADMKKVVDQLQKDTNDVWNQLKAAAEAKGGSVQGARLSSWSNVNGMQSSISIGVDDLLLGLDPAAPTAPPGDKPPTVIISEPTWKEGTYTVSAPQSTDLVSHRVAQGPLSLLGNNVAAANMDLTSAGATFMMKTLTNQDGSGATDLSPIQVTYQLKFLARVPPVKLLITADSRALYSSIRDISHQYQDNSCSEDVMNHSDQQLQMAVQSGLINVQFDTGTMDLSNDFLQQLYNNAMKFVMDQIKQGFFEKKPAAPTDGSDDKTKDFVDSQNDIYYFKSEFDEQSMHIAYNATVDSIQEWPANPQGTLTPFLAGLSADKMKQFVRTVDLTDPFFETLGLNVTCFANWATEPIAFVECQLKYEGTDENGQPAEKDQAFTFTKDHTTDLWDPRLINAKREYSYRYRVGYNGHDPGNFSDWQTNTAPKLNLLVGDPGKVGVKVLAGNIDFANLVRQVQIEMTYKDDASTTNDYATTFVLANGQLEGDFVHYIYHPWTSPVSYVVHFFLKNDEQIDVTGTPTKDQQLLINQPTLANRLDVQLFPAGSWDNVLQTVVDVRYTDQTNQLFLHDSRLVKTPDQFMSWTILLKDQNNRKFQYKYMTSFKDGSPMTQIDWATQNDSQTVPIIPKQSPALRVKLLPNLLDYKTTPDVSTTLHYDDPTGNVHKTDSFVFTDTSAQSWVFPIADDSRRTYRYQVTYYTVDGQSLPQPEVSTDETNLVVPRLMVPKIGANVIARLLDLAQTPVVQVDVEYHDTDHHLDYENTLVFTDQNPQSFSFQVEKDSPHQYQVTVTYYLANGQIVKRDPVNLDLTNFVIPRYVAAP